MATGLRLLVGLGNPGPRYELTRHNVGERWLRELAQQYSIGMREDTRFHGLVGRGYIFDRDLRFLIPTTYMNASGRAVQAICHYFKISAAETLIAHDEVAFPVGTDRLKVGGGHNGHNGLRSIIKMLGGESGFARLRIGVGHPGTQSEMLSYLTETKMPNKDRALAASSAALDETLLRYVLSGNWQKAMTRLHSGISVDNKSEYPR